MALNSPLDEETRKNLAQTHTASKVSKYIVSFQYSNSVVQSLLFTVNDLLVRGRLFDVGRIYHLE